MDLESPTHPSVKVATTYWLQYTNFQYICQYNVMINLMMSMTTEPGSYRYPLFSDEMRIGYCMLDYDIIIFFNLLPLLDITGYATYDLV